MEGCETGSKGREALSKEMGKGVKDDEKVEELGEAEVVLLAVKPAMLEKVVGWLGGRKDSYLLISILAGVTTERLAKEAGGKARVIRAMPNQALRVREGVTALCAGAGAKKPGRKSRSAGGRAQLSAPRPRRARAPEEAGRGRAARGPPCFRHPRVRPASLTDGRRVRSPDEAPRTGYRAE